MPARGTRWYGWQTLLCDSPAFVALGSPAFVGDGLSSPGTRAALVVGAAAYSIGPPIVHLAHEPVPAAKASAPGGRRIVPIVAPRNAASGGGWDVGLAGTF